LILARSDALAERAIRIWPGLTDGVTDESEGRDWSLLRRACAAIPPETWTTYGDLAELIGSHPVSVGVHLATHPVPNAWRVLTVDGRISPGFRWEIEGRTDDPAAASRVRRRHVRVGSGGPSTTFDRHGPCSAARDGSQ
jgi:alkylated DNA nucleotide flippase Atl1